MNKTQNFDFLKTGFNDFDKIIGLLSPQKYRLVRYG